MRILFKILILVVLSAKSFLGVGGIGGNIVFDPQNLATALEQLTALNKQIESSLKMLDQFSKVNKTLEQTENLIFNSYEKIYNPKRQIQSIIANAQNTFRKSQQLIERIKNTKLEEIIFKNNTNPYWRHSILYDQDDPKWQAIRKKIEESLKKDEIQRQKENAKLAELLDLKIQLRKALKKQSNQKISQIYQDYFTEDSEISGRVHEIEYLGKLLLESKDPDSDLTKQIQLTNQLIYKTADLLEKIYELNLEIANNQVLKEVAKENEETSNVQAIKERIDNLQGKRSYAELRAEAYKDCFQKSSLGIPKFGQSVKVCEERFQRSLKNLSY